MIIYSDNIENINPDMLKGFFEGWKKFPSPERHFEILKNSDYKFIAIEDGSKKVVGFINAISDNVLTVYIPLLEVLPEYRQGASRVNLLKGCLIS
jgi:hypothetical protein